MMFTSTNKILAGLASSGLALASLDCRPEGPVLPKPKLTSLESSSIVAKAADNLSSILDKAIDGSIKAGWDTTNSSFSLALVSLDQEDAGVPLWEYHHLAEANTEGTKEIGRDSQYLIGSISKSISDFIMLQVDIDIDAPVTEYLPDLAKSESKIDWEDVTLRMLGSHLAGVPANCRSLLDPDSYPSLHFCTLINLEEQTVSRNTTFSRRSSYLTASHQSRTPPILLAE